MLRPDGVWVDEARQGEPPRRTDASFTDWLGRWLDAAYVGEEFIDHPAMQDAPLAVLSQALDKTSELPPNSIKMTVSTAPGRPDRPCQSCVAVLESFGQDEAHVFGD